ncbi:MAG: 50S ribosomal protein L11 methyltransferase [Betaproteobacteria bacterium]|nr:50S ribosomal protein L11 methyltransferase [Betaproteobacteria bacterium]
MAYAIATLELSRDQAEALSDALIEAGALSVNVEDAQKGTADEKPIFGEPGAETGLWDRCLLSAMFADGADLAAAISQASAAAEMATPDFSISSLDDEDWVKKNRDQFQPIRISDRIWIVPTWHQAPQADAINISLDPGAAFGTGSHPTTRLCLQWLEENIAKVPKPSVIDYGCGSGILAIAAMKLGAASTIGVDIDTQAVEAARYNAKQNDVDIRFSTTDQTLDAIADITVANILANPLKVLAPLLASHTRAGGRLVLAGILDHQADEIITIYRDWFDMSVWKRDEGWSCIAGTRKH